MAALSDADRRAVWAAWMETNKDPVGIAKADLRAAFNAVDDWIDSNGASLLATFPEPAASSLTTAQKLNIFKQIANKRIG